MFKEQFDNLVFVSNNLDSELSVMDKKIVQKSRLNGSRTKSSNCTKNGANEHSNTYIYSTSGFCLSPFSCLFRFLILTA